MSIFYLYLLVAVCFIIPLSKFMNNVLHKIYERNEKKFIDIYEQDIKKPESQLRRIISLILLSLIWPLILILMYLYKKYEKRN